MGKGIVKDWNTSPMLTGQPSIVTGANLVTSTKRKPPKPKKAPTSKPDSAPEMEDK